MFNIKRLLKMDNISKNQRNGHKPNCMLIVESTKKRIFRYVPPRYIPADSFERDYKGDVLHILGIDRSGSFWPIAAPDKIEVNQSPKDLFMAKHCAEEVEEVYGLSIPMREKIKLGIFVGLIVAIIFVVFLMVSSAGGTNA